jgi:hypothetical protein
MATEEIYSLLETLAETYRETEKMSDTRLEVYALALADVPIDLLKLAVAEWIRKEKFFPRVSELRRLALQIQERGESESEFETPVSSLRKAYWEAMQVFNASLRGELAEADVYSPRYARVFQPAPTKSVLTPVDTEITEP